jgi:hypothetical protein
MPGERKRYRGQDTRADALVEALVGLMVLGLMIVAVLNPS